MINHPTTSHETTTDHHPANKPVSKNDSSSVRFSDLPLDILYRIASKLPPKEFARTSVLSNEWKCCMESVRPRLTFDAVTICKCQRKDLHKHFRQFVSEVDHVLQKHRDKVVETLEVRIDFVHEILARRIDTWVDFAISSRTKNLTLDLKPFESILERKDRYVFPFQLLDRGGISRLQRMQLSFVSLNPPPQFKGFPYLRKFHLQAPHVSGKDLEHVLSHCYILEWLRLDRCHLNEELVVDSPMSHLLYLRVDWCTLTKIKFNAVNLATFEYIGLFVPIDLTHSLKIQSANIKVDADVAFQHMLTSFLNGIPSVQNMSLKSYTPIIEKQWLWENPLKFFNLRRLQLSISIWSENVDKVLYLASFLRAMPLIQKLEVHFYSISLWLAEVGPYRKDLEQYKYNYLKDIWITGFKAARGQLEFLLNVVENAPELEVLLVEIGEYPPIETRLYGASGPPIEKAKQISISCLSAVLPHNVTFDVIE